MVAIKGKGWVLAASLLLLIRSFDDLYPGRDRRSDGSIGDQAHANRESDHNPLEGFVHAVDIDEDIAPGLDLKAWAEGLRLSRDPRIRYVIYEGRIFKSYRDPKTGVAAWTWQRYTGPSPHEGHLHISIDRTAVARDDLRPWPNALGGLQPAEPIHQEDDMPLHELIEPESGPDAGKVFRVGDGSRVYVLPHELGELVRQHGSVKKYNAVAWDFVVRSTATGIEGLRSIPPGQFAALAALLDGQDVDEAAIASAVLEALSPEAIAAAIPGGLAASVADELAARLGS